MQMGMGFSAEQQMRASPALVALNNMLVLTTHELQQLVQNELADNPALDQVESAEVLCAICGRSLQSGVCYACLSADRDLWVAERSLAGQPSSELDPLLSVPVPRSAIDVLELDLRAAVGREDAPIAEFLIGSLNSHGLLVCDVDEVAAQLRVPLYRVEHVLTILHEVGPPGTGARNSQECLLLQIDRLERSGLRHDLMRTVVADHWDDFVAHRYTALSRALGIAYDELLELRDAIRSHLQPYPLGSAENEDTSRPSTPLLDVTIVPEGDGFAVDVAESRRFSLRLNPLYQQLSQAVGRGQIEASAEEREHLRTHVSRARLFLTNLQHRRETIRKIAEHVVERQDAFLRHGIRHLKPLTRTEVGAALSLNDSTVSRATAHKYVLLPSREVIPFRTFFSASLSVKDVLKEIIGGEARPLTDDEIAARLRDRGFALARRTVAKYRGQLGILPATMR